MTADPASTTALNEANRNILLTVRDSSGGELEWEFFCECGREGCRERVFLTLDGYLALRDRGRAVLADGHESSQVKRAQDLRTEADALRRQADHQVKRAKKNLLERLRAPGVRHRE